MVIKILIIDIQQIVDKTSQGRILLIQSTNLDLAFPAVFDFIAAAKKSVANNNTEPMTIWILLGLGLLFTSRMMYTTLVYHTGAIPSEYYSLKKRPDYKTYQETTNIFFPGPKK